MHDCSSINEKAQHANLSDRKFSPLPPQKSSEHTKITGAVKQMTLFDLDNAHESQLITFEEVCEMLSVSKATGRNWIKLGKLIPTQKEGRHLLFERRDIDRILQDISNGESRALSRRRNKRKASGLLAYESYISSQYNINFVNNVITKYQDKMNPAFLRSILANIALQFIHQKKSGKIVGNALDEYLHGRLPIDHYGALIDDLVRDKNELLKEVDLKDPIFMLDAEYVPHEDVLGFIYISLVNLAERKAAGTYYTPLEVVNKLVTHLANTIDISGKRIFDPCCGSGNFLLAIGEHTNTPELIYGQDIDLIAVQLARISFALKYGITDLDFLYKHFTCADTLDISPRENFDIVLGNPPWGGELSKERLVSLGNKYKTVVKNGTETYDVFIEHAISRLTEKGILAFVLPEAVLNVSAHTIIREILINECNFKFVQYLGNVFSGVQCPSIILGVEKAADRQVGVNSVYTEKSNECYTLHSNRQISAKCFNFHVRDEVQDCIDELTGFSNFITLSGNAKFALGIVTGDNANYISDVCGEGYEPVLKGSNVKKFRFKASEKYIRFEPQKFQQVAPAELYRAPEKLLYRFICESLVFAYDNQQTLSLNSCNILIPQIPDMSIKYILAILNSRIANFYFVSMFNSVKVLRSQIEQIPIPLATASEQKNIIDLVEKITASEKNIFTDYDELDDCIMSLYGLDASKRQTVTNTLTGRNLFLV